MQCERKIERVFRVKMLFLNQSPANCGWMGALSLIVSLILNIETRPNLRKRRDLREVQFEVTMDISTDDDGDFQEFQLLHHHSRIRRSARQCGSQICNGEFVHIRARSRISEFSWSRSK